jgi:hypothetical protein
MLERKARGAVAECKVYDCEDNNRSIRLTSIPRPLVQIKLTAKDSLAITTASLFDRYHFRLPANLSFTRPSDPGTSESHDGGVSCALPNVEEDSVWITACTGYPNAISQVCRCSNPVWTRTWIAKPSVDNPRTGDCGLPEYRTVTGGERSQT